jgi:2-hydroxychromene-2-carboxylate isomerase
MALETSERDLSLQFWYEFASTYSYLAVFRIERLAAERGVAIEWRPFLLGPIFAAQGWNDSPFNVYPAKGRYMWRDLERLCAREQLPFRRPSRFPRHGLLAARIALVASDEGWCGDFTRAVFRANFAEDREISSEETIAEVLRSLDRDPATVLPHALAAENKDALKLQTEEAQRLGIFGAPSFVARGELFWGNDRLDDALAWASPLHRVTTR